MGRVGFIHDQLDLKFLLLYITSRVAAPIGLPTLADLALCDEGVEYFDVVETLADLVRTEHLTFEAELYAITDKGRKNGSFCESGLPYSVRKKCDKNVARLNSSIRRDAQVRASCVARPDGTFTLQLGLDDEHGNLFTLELFTASEEQGEHLAQQFRNHPEQVYNGVLDVLLTDFHDK